MHVGGVGRDHEKDHQCAHDAGDSHRQDFPDRYRNQHLAVDRPEGAGFPAVHGRHGRLRRFFIPGGIQRFADIELPRFAEDHLHPRGDLAFFRHRDHIRPDRVEAFFSGGFLNRFDGELLVDPIGARTEIQVVDEGERRYAQQQIHHVGKTVSPGAEHRAHFLFVRIFGGRIVTLRSAPGHPVEHTAEHSGKDIKQVEGSDLAHVVGVQHALSRRTVHQCRDDLAVPGEAPDDINHDDRIERIRKESLHTVGHHDGDLAAHGDDPDCHAQEDQQQKPEGGEFPAADVKIDRQVEEIHQAARSDRGEDRVVDDSGDRLQDRGKDPESPAVAHLQKLSHGHGPGFAEPVSAVAGQPQNQRQRHRDISPEPDSVTDRVVHFPHRHQRDESHVGFTAGHADHVAARHPAGGKKVRHAFYILL